MPFTSFTGFTGFNPAARADPLHEFQPVAVGGVSAMNEDKAPIISALADYRGWRATSSCRT